MSEDNSYSFDTFLAGHKQQLLGSGVPEIHWETLHVKLKNEVFDAGRTFELVQVEDEDEEEPSLSWMVRVVSKDGVKVKDKQHIYLIDHAWTYQARHARRQLNTVTGLLQRVAPIMDLPFDGSRTQEELVEGVLSKMWRYNQTYQFQGISNDDDESLEPLWYVMDELGARVQHSDEPSVRVVPFFYAPAKTAFSLLWPLEDLDHEDEVTRDFADGVADETQRMARLSPWFVYDFSAFSGQNEEFPEEYFQRFSVSESLPSSTPPPPQLPADSAIKVFSDIQQVRDHLTLNRFTLVEDREEANVWWLKDHFTDYRSLSAHTLVNQFPNEMLLTVKAPLAAVSRRAAPADCRGPAWLPVTYDLSAELPHFLACYNSRQQQGLDNHWIVKAWNLARGLDIHITDNAEQIARLAESGPKVACKYIERPLLLAREDLGGARVKFDLRYMVLLSSTSPLRLAVYKVFWLRFANKAFSLDDLDDYEKHFTVMNYQNPEQLKQVHYDEFIPMFEKQYPEETWSAVEGRILSMLRELFSAAVSAPYPRGLPAAPHSRAIYAVDLMLHWGKDSQGEKEIQPMVCEVNFSPDCERACKYHPDFYNDIFSTLFLDKTEGVPVHVL